MGQPPDERADVASEGVRACAGELGPAGNGLPATWVLVVVGVPWSGAIGGGVGGEARSFPWKCLMLLDCSSTLDTMDLSKYPLEKLLYFVAGIVPGFVALLIYHVASHVSFAWLFSLGFLGYRTKIALVLMAAFAVGNSMTRFLDGLLGGIRGAVQGAVWKNPQSLDVAPWRDHRWRVALAGVLGSRTPDDRPFVTESVWKIRRSVYDGQPDAIRNPALLTLDRERAESVVNDGDWERWYRHYHWLVLKPGDRDVVQHVQNGLSFNLQTASVYALISVAFVPELRHWWCILPASWWTFDLLNGTFWGVRNGADWWFTLDQQITYLTQLPRGESARSQNA